MYESAVGVFNCYLKLTPLSNSQPLVHFKRQRGDGDHEVDDDDDANLIEEKLSSLIIVQCFSLARVLVLATGEGRKRRRRSS